MVIGVAMAAYSVYTAQVTFDVDEAFTGVGYGIVGDTTYPDWATALTCGDVTTFVDINGLVLDNILPGESRTFCVQFDNDATVGLDYDMTVTPSDAQVSTGITSGTALAEATTTDEATIIVDADASPIVGLTADAELTRG